MVNRPHFSSNESHGMVLTGSNQNAMDDMALESDVDFQPVPEDEEDNSDDIPLAVVKPKVKAVKVGRASVDASKQKVIAISGVAKNGKRKVDEDLEDEK